MIRKFILPLIAVIGVAFAIYTVRASQKELPPAKAVAPPPTSDYQQQIAGAGLVEAQGENIAISSVVPGVVESVHAQVGDHVKKGQKLFSVEAGDLQAQLSVRQAQVAAAEERLAALKASPRPEDVPPAEAKVAEGRAILSDRMEQLNRLDTLRGSGAVGQDESQRAAWAVEVAKAQLTGAEAALAKIKAGTWAPDIKVAEADVASARAQVDALKIEWNRRTVVAPSDGKILQVRVRAGEFAAAGVMQTPLMVLGQTATLHVRVDIDENDAWRLKPGSVASASLRGNSALKTNLSFVRVEPYVIPKRSLTGESTERVDTRVLQVIYKVEAATFPIYVGQQMDVFIDAAGK
ncbi:MAG: efflux RND transporter periplasmic adaptor subunit [Burkholderiales bacterium]|nr:efflux RND transporter periplasmic adaptor subunit [Phycisphaerae bacterium]